MKTNTLVPFISLEESVKFYLNGRVYQLAENTLTEVETVEPTLRNAILALESFDFVGNSIKWHNGANTFVYDMNEGTFSHGSMLIEGNTFTDHVLAAGTVRYGSKLTAELFESLPSLVENFIVLDFAATFENNNITIDLFKVEEKVYVSRFNSETRIAKFFEAANANEALEYVNEQTNEDASSFLSELLEGEAKELADKAALVEKYTNMVNFLKDQRGLLAEADKSIEEIKAADTLINSEITTWETKIAELNA